MTHHGALNKSARRWLSLLVFSFAGLAGADARGQALIIPDHVTSDPILVIDKTDATLCGVRIHSLALENNLVTDYMLKVSAIATTDGVTPSRALTLVTASVYVTPRDETGTPKGRHIEPIDLTINLRGVPETIRFEKADRSLATLLGAPENSFSGYPEDAPRANSTVAGISVLMAFTSQQPSLVTYRLTGTDSRVVRVTDNLSPAQNDALTDCFNRMTYNIRRWDSVKK